MKELSGEALIHDHATHRDHLQGMPVHCGDTVLIWRQDHWEWARYEMAGPQRTGYLVIGDKQTIPLDGTESARWPETWEK